MKSRLTRLSAASLIACLVTSKTSFLATLALAATLITWHSDGTLTFLHDEPCASADLGGWLEERFQQPAKRAINIARDGREIAACWVEYDDGKTVVVLSADDRVRSKLYVD